MATKKAISDNADKVISDSKKAVSDDNLTALLDNINMDAIIEKSAKNRSIWTDKAKSTFGKTEKSARRKLRTLQLDFSKAVVRNAKLNDKIGIKASALILEKFYKDHLVDFSIYTNVSIENNPVNHNILTTAYKVMISTKK
jgi:hypothetical protein